MLEAIVRFEYDTGLNEKTWISFTYYIKQALSHPQSLRFLFSYTF